MTRAPSIVAAFVALFCVVAQSCGVARAAPPAMLNAPVDVSTDFFDDANALFVAGRVAGFDEATGRGTLTWTRSRWRTGYLFNTMTRSVEPAKPDVFPAKEYPADPTLPFTIEPTGPRTVRIRLQTTAAPATRPASLMLVAEPTRDGSWTVTRSEKRVEYKGEFGSVTLTLDPFRIDVRDAGGTLLTTTAPQPGDALPLAFVRRASDFSRSVVAPFALAPGERVMGLGEQFGPLDKRGQHVVLYTTDVLGAEKPLAYKPIPFFLSNRGYGMFVHASTPITCDVGARALSTNALFVGDDALDLFVFLGKPKDVVGAYADVTGRSPLPPLWSFGLWMSRITYKSEQEVREVARHLRADRIPADVIHLDTGWFQTDWRCDYQFAKDRFDDPAKMIGDLKADGFHVSLWQLPYFVPANPLFAEIVQKGLAVHDAAGGGGLPGDDAILDFSNPATVAWYQDKLAGLLRMGVGAIKTDFGEAAPLNGLYASGRTGFYEHNLYPLRYQQVVHDVTKRVTGDDVIWARAGWAGSQRFPLHWSGDSSCTDGSMAATLRAGLSLGACGFSFWSHDIGGFGGHPSPDLYKRWAAFGLLTSHSRCHGDPPREPWAFPAPFEDAFRQTVEMKYRLMPYIWAQAKDSSDRGLPMLRALYIEFPDDPGAWRVDDEYLLGSALLVAPLLEANATARDVYLPPGEWVDYQSNRRYPGGTWHHIEAGPVAAVVLVRAGTALPLAAVAQSTSQIDWRHLTLAVYPDARGADALVFAPGDDRPRSLHIAPDAAAPPADDGKIAWTLVVPEPAAAR